MVTRLEPAAQGCRFCRFPQRPLPVQIDSATILGLVYILEELRGLILQHGITQHLGPWGMMGMKGGQVDP